MYDVPSHFQDRRWDEDDYSQSESNRILNNPKQLNFKIYHKVKSMNGLVLFQNQTVLMRAVTLAQMIVVMKRVMITIAAV